MPNICRLMSFGKEVEIGVYHYEMRGEAMMVSIPERDGKKRVTTEELLKAENVSINQNYMHNSPCDIFVWFMPGQEVAARNVLKMKIQKNIESIHQRIAELQKTANEAQQYINS